MRKIIVFENITLNGLMAGPNGEIDWAIRDEEITENSCEGDGAIDAFMFGRVTYDMMASFWPTPMAKAANPVFADALNNAKKIVFSHTLKDPTWQPTEVIRELRKDRVMQLKASPGKDIMIFGSGSIVDQLARLGLIDEYQLLVNPVVLPKGMPLFTESLDKLNLKLVKTKTFKNGIVLVQYQPV
jgi:dihydrofolate reductase